LKDMLSVAGPLGVTHFVIFRESRLGFVNVRFARTPRGPTLTFRVERFSLAADVHRAQRRPLNLKHTDYEQAPLLVMSNLESELPHVQLLATMFRNFLPPLDLKKLHLEHDVKRALLLDWNEDIQVLEWRHYGIRVRPLGLSRAIRRLVERRGSRHGALAAGHLWDVSDLADPSITGALCTSESEAEGPLEFQFERWRQATDQAGTTHAATAAAFMRHGTSSETTKSMSARSRALNAADLARRASVRLAELGPRMTLRLLKIEEGLSKGAVLYRARSTANSNANEAVPSGNTV
jgi:ribosome biogenesis protein SSF1/2